MSTRETIIKLLGLFKNHRKAIAAIIGCLLIYTGLNLSIPLINRQIMDEGFIGGNRELLIKLVFILLAIYGVSSAIDIVKEKMRVDITAKIQYFLSEQSYFHLMKLKISYFNNTNYAETLNNINTDIDKMSAIADNSTFFVVTQVFSMIGGVVGLFIIDYRMTLLVLLFMPFKFFVMKGFAQKQRTMFDGYIKACQEYAKWFGDTVGGAREVRLFGVADQKYAEFAHHQKGMIGRQKQINMLMQWNIITDSIMIRILSTLFYIIGANLVFNLQLSIGSVFAFITYSAYVTGPISAILNIGYYLSGIIPSTQRYYEFMALEEEAAGGEITEVSAGDLQMKGVSFAYEADRPVLNEIDILFANKSKTALVGKNGSGKTTIINLLTRMYEPDSGQIFLNGTDISMLSLEAYRNLVSVVSQQIYLFNDTIRNNICLYRQVDDEAILSACQDSGLAEFLQEVSLDFVVGNNGGMLSGGQKQKIALARALIHDKPILIFDEATSNADVYSEQQINSLLHTRLKDKTVIVIAHRQEVLLLVDQVIYLENGKVLRRSQEN